MEDTKCPKCILTPSELLLDGDISDGAVTIIRTLAEIAGVHTHTYTRAGTRSHAHSHAYARSHVFSPTDVRTVSAVTVSTCDLGSVQDECVFPHASARAHDTRASPACGLEAESQACRREVESSASGVRSDCIRGSDCMRGDCDSYAQLAPSEVDEAAGYTVVYLRPVLGVRLPSISRCIKKRDSRLASFRESAHAATGRSKRAGHRAVDRRYRRALMGNRACDTGSRSGLRDFPPWYAGPRMLFNDDMKVLYEPSGEVKTLCVTVFANRVAPRTGRGVAASRDTGDAMAVGCGADCSAGTGARGGNATASARRDDALTDDSTVYLWMSIALDSSDDHWIRDTWSTSMPFNAIQSHSQPISVVYGLQLKPGAIQMLLFDGNLTMRKLCDSVLPLDKLWIESSLQK